MNILLITIIGGVAVYFITKMFGNNERKEDNSMGEGIKNVINKLGDTISGRNDIRELATYGGDFPIYPKNWSSKEDGQAIETYVFDNYTNYIEKYCKINGLPPILVASLIYNESSGNPTIKNVKGTSYGLMQVEKGALEDYNKKFNASFTLNDMLDAEKNIMVGTWYLRNLVDICQRVNLVDRIETAQQKEDLTEELKGHRLNHNYYHALRCYNAGQGNVLGRLISVGLQSDYKDGLIYGVQYANKVTFDIWGWTYSKIDSYGIKIGIQSLLQPYL